MYWPWLAVNDAVSVPPSGHVAGVWGRTDLTRGVHKAPANEEILGIAGLACDADPDRPGVNWIRAFPGRGIRIWGARTLAEDTEFRYVNVRRLVNHISATIIRGTEWAVFEPNDELLWGELSDSVTTFLTRLWRKGALLGTSPDDAFFVRCDGDLGRVDIAIGLALLRPSEFVIFQISQFQPGDE